MISLIQSNLASITLSKNSSKLKLAIIITLTIPSVGSHHSTAIKALLLHLLIRIKTPTKNNNLLLIPQILLITTSLNTNQVPTAIKLINVTTTTHQHVMATINMTIILVSMITAFQNKPPHHLPLKTTTTTTLKCI